MKTFDLREIERKLTSSEKSVRTVRACDFFHCNGLLCKVLGEILQYTEKYGVRQ